MTLRRAWGSLVWRDGKAYARVRISGRRTWRLLKTERGKPVTKEAQVEAAMDRLRDKVRDLAALRSGERARLGEWLDDEYSAVLSASLEKKSRQQAEAYIVHFAHWLHGSRGNVFMDQVGLPDIQRFCAAFMSGELRKIGSGAVKASYLRRYVNVLRKAWNDAIERGFAADNPWRKAPVPRIQETHVPWISPGDLRKLYAKVAQPHRALVILVGETGMRPSEALAMRREDVDLERKLLHVRAGKTRAARRTVPLTDRAVKLLRSLPKRDDGLVLEPVFTQVTVRVLATACGHLKLPSLSLRSLRHAFASHLVVSGCPPTVVASLLGHSDGGALVLRLYGRWYPPDAQSRAVAGLAAFRSKPGSAPASRATSRRRGARAG